MVGVALLNLGRNEPSTMDKISVITSSSDLPLFASRLGFVVTPLIMPRSAAAAIYSVIAVSIKIFTIIAPKQYL